nr:hypothetical protein [Streptomyces apocyni]
MRARQLGETGGQELVADGRARGVGRRRVPGDDRFGRTLWGAAGSATGGCPDTGASAVAAVRTATAARRSMVGCENRSLGTMDHPARRAR